MVHKKRARQVWLLAAGAMMMVACGQTPQASAPVRRPAGSTKASRASTPTPGPVASKPVPARPLVQPSIAAPTPSSAVPLPASPTPDATPSPAVPGATPPLPSATPVSPEFTPTPVAPDDSSAPEPLIGLLNDPGWQTEITDVKNGVIAGLGTFRCTVKVWHDDPAQQTGVLRVTFKEKDKDSATPPGVKLITVGPNAVQSFPFEDKNWRTREAVAQMVTTSATRPLAAFVTAKKNGLVLGMGTYSCQVLVVNPLASSQSGTLAVQFLNKGKPGKTPIIRTAISLAAQGSQTLSFTDKNWQTDDVVVSME